MGGDVYNICKLLESLAELEMRCFVIIQLCDG